MPSPAPAFGPWLKARRQAADLTLDGLAAQAACSPVMIRKLENGDRRPSAALAGHLAAILGLPAADHPAFVAWARSGPGAAPAGPAPAPETPCPPLRSAPAGLPLAHRAARPADARAPDPPGSPPPAPAATIADNYTACPPAEQLVLRTLAVFVGGATLDALEAVLAAAELGDPAGLLDAVEALVDKRLVLYDPSRPATPRVALPAAIREFVADRVTADGAGPLLRQAHAGYFAALVGRAAPDAAAHAALAEERANLRQALDWYATQAPADGLALLLALLPVWAAAGDWEESRPWLARLLEAADPPPAIRSRACYWAGRLCSAQGDYRAAEPLLHQARALAEAAARGPGLADILAELGQCAEAGGADRAAMAYYAQSLQEYGGQAPGAARAAVLCRLGRLHLQQGEPDQAQAVLLESLAIWRQQGSKAPMIEPLLHLGDAARSRQAWDQALAYYREAERLAPGPSAPAAAVQRGLGYVALARRDRPAAQAAFRAALAAAHDDSATRWAAAAGLAATLLTGPRSGLPAGIRLAAAVETALIAAGGTLLPPDAAALATARAAARSRLAPATWTAAGAEGGGQPLDHLLTAILLQEPGPPPATLSEREQDVVRLLAQGRTNREIAAALIVSSNTVQKHLSHIYDKLGVHTRSALTRYAVDHDLIAPR
ncbi:MAG TPA: LuxR C-terminal-related transcriptional regulator [Chloroflexia bacterium]|nr:LuxR C-terminal-related transcriptional regulator [Chloroflexia bacterium]